MRGIYVDHFHIVLQGRGFPQSVEIITETALLQSLVSPPLRSMNGEILALSPSPATTVKKADSKDSFSCFEKQYLYFLLKVFSNPYKDGL